VKVRPHAPQVERATSAVGFHAGGHSRVNERAAPARRALAVPRLGDQPGPGTRATVSLSGIHAVGSVIQMAQQGSQLLRCSAAMGSGLLVYSCLHHGCPCGAQQGPSSQRWAGT
jgi:hypothetical protein